MNTELDEVVVLDVSDDALEIVASGQGGNGTNSGCPFGGCSFGIIAH